MVQNDSGEMVPLTAFADVRHMLGARKIERFNQNMSAAITAIPVTGASTARIMDGIERLLAGEFGEYGNLLYDLLCLALPWDHVDEEVCSRPLEWSGRTLGRFMQFFGPISSVFDLLTFVYLFFVVIL